MAAKQKKVSEQASKEVKRKPKVAVPAFEWNGGFFKKHLFGIILIALAAALPYIQSIPYGYVLDDTIVIAGNKFTQKGIDGLWDILSTESMTGYFGEQKDLVAGARYRPLSIMTFAIEHEISPNNPKIGHLGNILFYVITCILLFRVLLLLFPMREGQTWWWNLPFWATVLYALHPLHTEVVANIKGRDEIMTFLGALGSLWFALRWLSDRQTYWLIGAGISMFLGLLSKENAITFLAVIPISLYFFTNARRKEIATVTFVIGSAAVLYLLIRYQVIGYFLSSGKQITDLMNNPFVEMNGGEKLATIMYTLGLYLKLLVFPHPLCHDYYPYAIPIMRLSDWQVLLSLIVYGMLGWIFFKGYKTKSVPAYAVFFYIATISIVSNLLFPVGTFMNERFIFISSAAFCIAVAWLLSQAKWPDAVSAGRKWIGIAVLLSVSAAYAFKTYTRVPVWENALTLNRAAIAVSPNSARANTFITTAIFNKYKEETDPVRKQEMLNEMGVYIRKAIEIYPAYYSGLQMFVGVIAEEHKVDNDTDKLLRGFKQVLTHRDHMPFIDEYLDYLERQPAQHQSLVNFYYDIGYRNFWQTKRKKAYAIKFLERAARLAPSEPLIVDALNEVKRG